MKLYEPTPLHVKSYEDWVNDSPPAVKAIAQRLNGWTLYVIKETNQLATLVAVNENGTVRVVVWGLVGVHDDRHAFLEETGRYPRGVFGVNPDGLVAAPEGTRIPPSLREEVESVRFLQ